jgi:hypothetical protein
MTTPSLGIADQGLGIGPVTRLARRWLTAVMLSALAAGPAAAQSTAGPAQASAVAPVEVAVAPIECWWKTDRNAARVGERFSLTLTCAVLDTDRVKVMVDESSLAPSALHLVPFEIVEGQRFRDIQNGRRKFFQYQYTIRVLGEEFFGKDITLPRLQLSYHVQNSLSGGTALAGRESQYSLPSVPVRILSLVPAGAADIRDAPRETFGDVDARMFRSNLLLIVAAVAFVLAGLLAMLLVARAFVSRRAVVASRHRVVPPWAALRAAARELSGVRKASEQGGWTGDLAGRAAAALRVAGAVAASRPIGQRELAGEGASGEGQIVVRRGIRRKRIALSSSITSAEGVSQPLAVFTAARYSRNGSLDGVALDSALAESQDVVRRMRLSQWRRIGRSRRPAAGETTKPTWAR